MIACLGGNEVMDRALDRIGSTANGSLSEENPSAAGISAMVRRGKVPGCAVGIRGRLPASGDIFVFARRRPRQVILLEFVARRCRRSLADRQQPKVEYLDMKNCSREIEIPAG